MYMFCQLQVFCCIEIFIYKQKKVTTKKVILSRQDIKDKICKTKINKQRLELRKIQLSARSLSVESKIKSSEGDIVKFTQMLEENITGPSKKDE